MSPSLRPREHRLVDDDRDLVPVQVQLLEAPAGVHVDLAVVRAAVVHVEQDDEPVVDARPADAPGVDDRDRVLAGGLGRDVEVLARPGHDRQLRLGPGPDRLGDRLGLRLGRPVSRSRRGRRRTGPPRLGGSVICATTAPAPEDGSRRDRRRGRRGRVGRESWAAAMICACPTPSSPRPWRSSPSACSRRSVGASATSAAASTSRRAPVLGVLAGSQLASLFVVVPILRARRASRRCHGGRGDLDPRRRVRGKRPRPAVSRARRRPDGRRRADRGRPHRRAARRVRLPHRGRPERSSRSSASGSPR